MGAFDGDSTMSLMSIYNQVNREGARWGLVALWRDNKVAVAEKVTELPKRDSDHVVTPVVGYRVICSLDESSPMDAFAMILRHRIKRHEHDFAALVRAQEDKKRAQRQAEIDLRARDFRAAWEARLIKQRLTTIGRLGLGK